MNKKTNKKEVIEEVTPEVEEVIEEVTPEVEEVIEEVITRECTCGNTVMLPNSSEEFTMCECGVKHAR